LIRSSTPGYRTFIDATEAEFRGGRLARPGTL